MEEEDCIGYKRVTPTLRNETSMITSVWTRLCRNVVRSAVLAMTLSCAVPALAEEPMTVAEVVAELEELTPKLTPFTVKHDAATKTLIFREEVESSSEALKGRVGELHARLDRMDSKRLHYQAGHPILTLKIQGKALAGTVSLFCLPNSKCISRGFNDSAASAKIVESDEEAFALDVFDGTTTINQLQRFGNLITHLIITSQPK